MISQEAPVDQDLHEPGQRALGVPSTAGEWETGDRTAQDSGI